MTPEIREWSLKRQISIGVMLSKVEVIRTIKLFVIFPKDPKVLNF